MSIRKRAWLLVPVLLVLASVTFALAGNIVDYTYDADGNIKETITSTATTVNITASSLSIQPGGTATLFWSSLNATSCSIDQGIGPVDCNSSISVSPAATITATGPGGTVTASTTVTVTSLASTQISSLRPNAPGDETNVPDQNPASGSHYDKVGDEFGADVDSTSIYNATDTNYRRDLYHLTNFAVMWGGMPGFGGGIDEIPEGDLGFAATINWIKVWLRSKYVNGQSYARTALKTGGTVYDGQEITLTDSYTDYLTQYLTNPETGAPWTVDDINALQAGVSLRSGGSGSSAYCTQVSVEVNSTLTMVSIFPSPPAIQAGEISTLTWDSTNATSCSIDQGIGSVATSGSIEVSPTTTTPYTITATGPGGTATASTTVTVTSASPQSLMLRPNGAGDETNIRYQMPSGGSHYDKVDEAAGDGDATSVYLSYVNTSYYRDVYNVEDTALTGAINWVRVWVRAHSAAGYSYAKTALKTGGSVYESSEITLSTGYTDYYTQYDINPGTGGSWSWGDINNLQAGVSLKAGGTYLYSPFCTQVYVEVNYTP